MEVTNVQTIRIARQAGSVDLVGASADIFGFDHGELTGYENLLILAKLYGIPRGERTE